MLITWKKCEKRISYPRISPINADCINKSENLRHLRTNDRPNYFIEDTETGEQRSLGTADEATAQRLLDAENQSRQNPSLNLQLGKAYMTNADPKMATRKWQEAMDELCSHGVEVSQKRCARALQSSAFNTHAGN